MQTILRHHPPGRSYLHQAVICHRNQMKNVRGMTDHTHLRLTLSPVSDSGYFAVHFSSAEASDRPASQTIAVYRHILTYDRPNRFSQSWKCRPDFGMQSARFSPQFL